MLRWLVLLMSLGVGGTVGGVHHRGDAVDRVRQRLDDGELEAALDTVPTAIEAEGVAEFPTALVHRALAAFGATLRYQDGVAFVEALAKAGRLDGWTAKEAATLFSELGLIARWAELLDDSIRRHPNDARLIVERARVHLSLKEFDRVLVLCRPLRDDDPDLAKSPGALAYLVGAAAAGVGDFERATTALRRCLERSPGHYSARVDLGRVYLKRKLYPEAIATLREVLRRRPKRPPEASVLQSLGQALLRVGEPTEATFVLREFRRANEIEEKRKDLLETLRLDPRNTIAIEQLAEFLVEHRPRDERTLAAVDRGLAIAPKSAKLLVARGRLHRAAGEVDLARQRLLDALRVDKNANDARLELAEIALSFGGLRHAERFLVRSQDKVDASRWNLAYCEFELRRGRGYEIAAPYARRAVEANPSSLEAVLAWVDLGRALGTTAETDRQLADWSEAHPDNPRFDVARGVLAAEAGDVDRAAEHFTTALARDPFFASTHWYRAQWLTKAGRSTEAKAARARAVELSRIVGG